MYQVKVEFQSKRVWALEDKPALGLESLLGTMGGTLNLWIGISFVTVIELIELSLNATFWVSKRPK